MKRTVAISLALILIATLLISGCGEEAIQFELTGGFGPENVEVRGFNPLEDGTPVSEAVLVVCLAVRFETTGEVTFRLTNPDGIETDIQHWDKERSELHKSIFPDEQPEVPVRLAGGYEVPKAGLYTLTVEDSSGKCIATYSYEFSGASLSVVELDLTWERNGDYYTLTTGRVVLTNDGDFPAWICAVNVKINGASLIITQPRTNWGSPLFVGLPPNFGGSDWLWLWDVNLGRISAGEKTLTLEMMDGADNIVYSYSCTLTPSEGIQWIVGP